MPQSWKSRPFTQAITRLKSHGGRLKTSQYRLKGSLPIVDQGATLIIGYTEQRACVFQGPYPVVVFGDHTRNVKLYQHEFAVGGEGVVLLRPRDEDELSTEFMYYWLKHVRLPDLGYSRHFKVLKEQVISFPSSIEEQRRIVSNIEAMTRRTEEARLLRKQARDEALRSAPHSYASVYRGFCAQYQTVPLGETGAVIGGGTPSKKIPDYWNGHIPWITAKEMKRFRLRDSQLKITDRALSDCSVKMISPDAVIFVVRGSILYRHVPIAVNTMQCTINQDMKAIIPCEGILSEYLAYMMLGANAKLMEMVDTAGNSAGKLPTDRWTTLQIPIAPLKKQRRIVRHLNDLRDKIDALTRLQSETDAELAAFTPALLAKAFRGEL